MSLSSWRQFPFFDCLPIRDPYYGSPDALYSDPTISAICSSPEHLIISTRRSQIKLIGSDFNLVYQFAAYDSDWRITKLKYIDIGRGNGFLCSIAEKQGLPLALKLWDLKKLMDSQKVDFNSDYHTLCQVTNGSNNYPLTCFASSVDFSILAFGFANGTVILVRGDLLHDRGSRQRQVYESPDPITDVHFKDASLLFVSTYFKIFTIPTTGRNQGNPHKMLEEKMGADIHCVDVLQDAKKNLVVARQESIQFYNSKSKAHNLMLDIPKSRLYAYKNKYVLLVSAVNSNLTSASTIQTNKLVIVDISNKFIAFNQTISNSVIDIFELWDDLYVLTLDGLLYKLHEKTTKQMVDIVVQRELFPIAIKLAESSLSEPLPSSEQQLEIIKNSQDIKNGKITEELTEKDIMTIQKQYGDFLYNKGEIEEAIQHYIKCIKLGKTSEILQKYKESSKIPFLIQYLEKFIDLELSNEDHVTLLLCSYCKLNQDDKLLDFINKIEIDEDYEIVQPHKKFDMDTVIRLCRETGYHKLASIIAKRFNQPSIVVDIQLTDLNNPKLAMRYVKGLPIDDLLRVLIDNVKDLLDKLPNEATQLLIEVFTGKYNPDNSFNLEEVSISNSSTKTEEIHDNSSGYPILTSYRQFASFMKINESAEGEEPPKPTYLPPRPRIIFQSFVDHPNEFVIFLEACVESYEKFGGNEKDKKDIMITLYEMYLSLSGESEEAKEEKGDILSWENKARELLNQIQKDDSWSTPEKANLLLLSNLGDFNEGEILIRESTDKSSEGFELDFFRSAVLSNNYDKSWEILNKYGEKEPDLYKLSLTIYTSNEMIFKTIGESKILEIINKIETSKLMTPLELIKQLSLNNNSFIKLGLVKQYLINYIKRQKQEIKNNTQLITSYNDESKKLTTQTEKLINDSQIINRPRCSSCSQPLEFPVIHFKCSHSYHEHCLVTESPMVANTPSKAVGVTPTTTTTANGTMRIATDDEVQCPRCVTEFDTMSILKRQHEEIGERNDLFKASLIDSNDRFKVMMGFFGRGAMEQTKTIYQ